MLLMDQLELTFINGGLYKAAYIRTAGHSTKPDRDGRPFDYLGLECVSARELELEAAKLKGQLDKIVERGRKRFAKSPHGAKGP